MRNWVKEFKEFIATGNMIELAVAVILGAVVATAIKVFVEGIMMQVVAAIVGQPNFNDVTITLRKNVDDKGADAVLQIGSFINALITLALTGFVLFLMVKAYNHFKERLKVGAEPEVPEASEVELLIQIRDALQGRTPEGSGGNVRTPT